MKRTFTAFLFFCLFAAAAVAQNPRYTVSGTITTGTSVVSIPSRDFDIATVTIHGTYAGVSIVFEFSDDGSIWYQDTCTRSDSPTLETGETVASNATLEWDCGVVATTNFRVRATAWTSGSATVNITMTQDPLEPTETAAVLGVYNSSAPTVASGASAPLQESSSGDLYVATRANPLATYIMPVGSATTTETVFAANAVSSPTNVAASGVHSLYDVCLLNNNAAVVFVEFFNVVQGSVTLGSTAPTDVYVIPASGTLCFNSDLPKSYMGASGFSMAAVTAYNGASTGSVTGSVHYK